MPASHAAMMLLAIFGADAADWGCDIAIHGLGTNMSGLWMFKEGEYLPGDNRKRYEQYEPMPPRGLNPSLEFNMGAGYYKKFTGEDAWLILDYHISEYGSVSDNAQIRARCTSVACVNTTDITQLLPGQHWEVANALCMCGPEGCDVSACDFTRASGPVTVGCCEEKPEISKCDSWTDDDCFKLKPSFFHGNHCQDSGCCTLYHQRFPSLPMCKKTYFPGGTRCKPSALDDGRTQAGRDESSILV